jgi:probable DNA metabolism protein
MALYIYDGSLEGFLTAVSRSLDAGTLPEDIVPASGWQSSLFASPETIETSAVSADRLINRLNALSRHIVRTICYCYLSERTSFELPVAEYIFLAFKYGKDVDRYHAHSAVNAVHRLSRKVGSEIHRLSGLVRFRKLSDGTFWAPIEPDHNVVLPLAWHFARRLPTQNWVIYDIARDTGIRWNTQACSTVRMDPAVVERIRRSGADLPDLLSTEEIDCQKLWQNYFNSVDVEGRTNRSLQKSNMPRRYWKYLVEKPGRVGF